MIQKGIPTREDMTLLAGLETAKIRHNQLSLAILPSVITMFLELVDDYVRACTSPIVLFSWQYLVRSGHLIWSAQLMKRRDGRSSQTLIISKMVYLYRLRLSRPTLFQEAKAEPQRWGMNGKVWQSCLTRICSGGLFRKASNGEITSLSTRMKIYSRLLVKFLLQNFFSNRYGRSVMRYLLLYLL